MYIAREALETMYVPTLSNTNCSMNHALDMQVDIQQLQKDLASDKGAASINLTSFHQYDDQVR